MNQLNEFDAQLRRVKQDALATQEQKAPSEPVGMPELTTEVWSYRRYGSPPEQGYTILVNQVGSNGEPIACLGDGDIAELAVKKICDAHNVGHSMLAPSEPVAWTDGNQLRFLPGHPKTVYSQPVALYTSAQVAQVGQAKDAERYQYVRAVGGLSCMILETGKHAIGFDYDTLVDAKMAASKESK